jgi:ElaB/YqjD/DUF883 family membrane-anchored ribosome-binding protein
MTNVAEGRQLDEGARERAGGAVEDATSAAQDKAMELRSKGANQLREQLDTRTTDVGRQARSVGQALRQSGEKLRDEGNTQAASVTDSAAQRVEQLGEYLERVHGDELLRDAERFARQRPWVLAGVGLFAGLVASRMMKASSERRYDSYEHGAQVGATRSA